MVNYDIGTCKHCGATGFAHHLWCQLLVNSAVGGLVGCVILTGVFIAISVFTDQRLSYGGLIVAWIIVLALGMAVIHGIRQKRRN